MIELQETGREQPEFEFTGGRLSLDFMNTVHDRLSAPRELLRGYDDLLLWGQRAGIMSEQDASGLRDQAAQHPAEAAQTLRDAVAARETMYRLFLAIADGGTPGAADFAAFNADLARAMAHARVVPADAGFAWGWDSSPAPSFERVLWPVLRSAADLLTSPDLENVRVCAAEDCGWLFLDESKNHSRRWCDMRTCGNRAKARRHYKQKKQVP